MTDHLDKTRALLAAATTGPWSVAHGVDEALDIVIHHTCESRLAEAWDMPNARLIAAAPELLAWCVAEIERLRAALSNLVALLPDPELDRDEVQRGYVLAAKAALKEPK